MSLGAGPELLGALPSEDGIEPSEQGGWTWEGVRGEGARGQEPGLQREIVAVRTLAPRSPAAWPRRTRDFLSFGRNQEPALPHRLRCIQTGSGGEALGSVSGTHELCWRD